MISRHTLILAARKSIQISAVERGYDVGYVVPLVIGGSGNLVWLLDGGNRELRWRNHEALIHENICTRGMVDRHERQIIVVIRFPEFRRNPQIVIAIVRNQFVRADFVPLFGRSYASRTGDVDAHAQRIDQRK